MAWLHRSREDKETRAGDLKEVVLEKKKKDKEALARDLKGMVLEKKTDANNN